MHVPTTKQWNNLITLLKKRWSTSGSMFFFCWTRPPRDCSALFFFSRHHVLQEKENVALRLLREVQLNAKKKKKTDNQSSSEPSTVLNIVSPFKNVTKLFDVGWKLNRLSILNSYNRKGSCFFFEKKKVSKPSRGGVRKKKHRNGTIFF